MIKEDGNNLCGFYVAKYIRMYTTETRADQSHIDELRDKLLPMSRVKAISEEIAGFLLREAIKEDGEFTEKE